MIPLIGWAICLYGGIRLITLPIFVPRRQDGSIDTPAFVYVMISSLLGVLGLIAIAYWLWVGIEAERKIMEWTPSTKS